MRLFRRHGYEGVSIADLTGAIGIAPPSLYAAFGSKAGLYREALDRYTALPGAVDGMAGADTLEQAVSGLLTAAIRAVLTDERGCMISTGLVEGLSSMAADLTGFGAVYHNDVWDYVDATHLYSLVSTESEGAISTSTWGAQLPAVLHAAFLAKLQAAGIRAKLSQTAVWERQQNRVLCRPA